ncbi:MULTISPECIES: CHASE3 domain-containing protein [unclassified Leptolyngbya]|uniref:sensor histidine kinase n=1 Tax=unclassified Leptolyngbya TaxID=2650499 RepID=UPI001688767F|nr:MULTISPECIES: CHASE3 domain-containing protein [unclassified Leptolyngbya]MBD1909126.1 CHASE3 domain-containing protein [Leptolyngbya sp. FACHB-8]MBD2157500.1 CHASE3 domain-containing protein [Leptolyngbya sp. FACHB-16]
MLLQRSENVFRRKLTRAIALPIVLLLLLAGVSIWQITRLLSALQWVDHTNQVISQANYIQKLLLDRETGFRGYLLTGRQEFLEPYEQANEVLDPSLEKLGKLVSDNPVQTQRVDQLLRQSHRWEAQVTTAITRKRQNQTESLIDFERRKQQMDRLRHQIAVFIATEEQLRDQRSNVAQRTTRSVILTSLFLASGIGIILAYFVYRQILKVSRTYENALHTAQLRTEEAQRAAIALEWNGQRLVALHNIDRAILAAETDETLIRNAFSQLRQIVPHEYAFVVVFDLALGTAKVLTGSGQTEELSLPTDRSLSLDSFVCDQDVLYEVRYVKNLGTVEVLPPVMRQLCSYGFRSCLSVPLLTQNVLIGELNLASTDADAFDEPAQEVAQEVAAQLAIALQQSRMRTQLQEYASQLEQRVAERTLQLEETNQELEAFTYSVSHDLRAPLRTIQGFTSALLEDCGDKLDEDCQGYVASIIEDATQMNGLINDLLAYSRLTSTQINLQPVALDDIVNEALRQLAVEIQQKQAQIHVASPLPQVIAHRSTLIQAITNLISNAIKFVESDIKPQVDIFNTVERQNNQDWIRLWIVDNGIGIASEHQERVFRVFERLHGNESYPGTGIGLAIAHKGLDRMGGRVGMESQLGQGSRFWISLPSAVLPRSKPTYDPNSPSSGN